MSSLEDLANMHCQDIPSDQGPLEEGRIKELLGILNNKWNVNQSNHLQKTFSFSDFKQALVFVNEIGRVAEEENHHPDILLRWGEVQVEIWTHSVGGLSKNDFILAAKIERKALTA